MKLDTLDVKQEVNNTCVIKVHKEADISWSTQHQIHFLLNTAFDNVSTKFIARTYGNIRPVERVLGRENDKLVVHLGMAEDIIAFDDATEQNVTWLGLFASIAKKRGLTTEISGIALEHLKNQGIDLAIALSNHPFVLRHIATKFRSVILDVPVVGSNSTSKNTDKLILFPLLMNDERVNEIVEKINISGRVCMRGEVF